MSNGIGKNPLTDISKVYLQQIANESAVPGKPAEKLKTDRNMFNIPKDEQQAAKERVLAKTKKKQMEKGISSPGYTKEGLDPVNPVAVKKKFANRKDRDLDNDGDTDSSDKYLHKRRKAIAGAMKKRMSEGVRDMDPEKGTAERKARLEKKRGMKLDDHPQYKKEEVEVDEAMRPGPRREKMRAKMHDPYVRGGSKSRGQAHNIAVRGDVSTGDPAIKSRGGGGVKKDKGMGYGDQGAGNKARRRMGQEPLRGNTRKEEVEVVNEKINPALKGILKKTPKGEDPEKGGVPYKITGKMTKEGFSNWRTDLSEVMTDEIDSKPVKEKKINNKIKINPKLGEAVEALGGEILEVTEVDEAVYGGTPAKKEEPKDNRMVVTAADKKGNTPAYQRMKAGDKRYKPADHMKEAASFKKIQEKLNLKKTQWGV